ncbi:MAG: CheW domain-containing protein [Polyangiaceae bacterium]|nr:CheW domain-containing protein [Polyangiaceae bacterium]
MSLDFALLRQRLEESFARSAGPEDDAAIEQLLRARGQELAARTLEEVKPDVFGTVVVARRRETMLAFRIECLREIRSVRLTRLPHATRSVCGIFQLRGQLFSLVDLRSLVGESEPLVHGAAVLVAMLEHDGKVLGVRIDEVIGPRVVLVEELDRGHRERPIDFVQEVTRDCVEILDVPAVFACRDFHMGERT